MEKMSDKRKSELLKKYPMLKTLDVSDIEWSWIDRQDCLGEKVIRIYNVPLEIFVKLTKRQQELVIEFPTIGHDRVGGLKPDVWKHLDETSREYNEQREDNNEE